MLSPKEPSPIRLRIVIMRIAVFTAFAVVLAVSFTFAQQLIVKPSNPTEVMVVGFAHLSQLASGSAPIDVLAPLQQESIKQLDGALMLFHPDTVMVEVPPEEQGLLDAEFQSYANGPGTFEQMRNPRSETYQVAFRIAKEMKLHHVVGVDYYDATPQGMLAEGKNVEMYQEDLKRLQALVREKNQQLYTGKLSLYDYVKFINAPETIEFTHQLLFNVPAYVRDGDFKNPPKALNMTVVDKRYVGAEFISLFYNRNLKLYANMLTAQKQEGSHRVLVTLGQTHVGVLQELLRHNPHFLVVEASRYIK